MAKTSKTARVTPKALDVAALEQMIEPLTVQIVRIKNGQYSPIALPVPADATPGTGWSRGEVLAIDQGWLVNHWSGGGLYEITVTDSAQPEPQKLMWSAWWDPAQFPEKVPPTMTQGLRPGLAIVPPPQPTPTPAADENPSIMVVESNASAQHAQPQQGQSMALFPNGLPSGGLLTQPAPTPQVRYMQTYDTSGYGYAAQAQQEERRRIEERLANAENALRQAQLETATRTHQIELERVRAEYSQNYQRLEQRLAEMGTPKTDSTVEQLRAQLAQQQAQAEADRRERDAERREAAIREQMVQQNQAIQAQLAQMQQNFQAMLAQMQTKGPDPMIQLMIEQNRNSMEAMKEIARQSNDALRQMQGFMMNPRDVMAMTKEANNGIDGVTSKISAVFGQALDMQQKVLENALQLQQGGNETIGLIRDGIGGVQELANRYFTVKSKETQVTQQAQATAAQAQAHAQAITAQAQAAIAQAQSRAAQPQPQMQPAPARPQIQAGPSSGLGGPAQSPAQPPRNGTQEFQEWRRRREEADAAAQAGAQPRETAATAETPSNVPNNVVPIKQVRSDEEWFGPLLDEVQKTRKRVNDLMTALKAGTANQLKEPATPDVVAGGIIQALQILQAHNVQVPAMTELLFADKIDEFMAVFLPNAPVAYHKDVIAVLEQLSRAAEGEGEDVDEEEEGDEDGENHDDVRDGSS